MTALPFKTSADRVRGENPDARCVLALDMATQLGAAIQHVDGRIAHQSIRFPQGSHKGHQGASFRKWLTKTHKASPFDVIFYEEKNFNSQFVQSNRILWHFEANLLSWACIYGIEPIPVAIQSIKKFITGNGHAKKPEVIAAVEALGYEPKDDNAADALALLLLGLERMAGEAK